jgi:glycosyltransferase involved in cell wall biosynthesis
MRLLVISHSSIIDTNQPLFAEMEKQGVTLRLLVPELWKGDLGGPPLKPQRLPGFEAPIVPLKILKAGSVPLHVYCESLARQFYLFQPDAIYVENESYALSTFQAAWVNRLTLKRPFLFRNNQNLFKRLPPPFAWMERFVLNQTACANVVNDEAGTRLRAKGYRGRIAYVPYGVDPAFYRPLDARSLRQELGLKGLVFGYIGRLIEEKGLHDLLEAFRRFHPEEETSLLVVGSGPLKPEIEALFETPEFQGRARFLSVVPHRDVPNTLSAMDVLVLPSRTTPRWKEQFGRVLIEALACGVPVIGSNSGEIPTLIERLQGGLIVPEANPQALHDAMRRFVETPELHDQLRERGRREVEQQYSHGAIAYRFSQLLQSIVDDRTRGSAQEDTLPDWAT